MQKKNTKTQKCKCKKETANAKKIAVTRRQASNAKENANKNAIAKKKLQMQKEIAANAPKK